LELCVPCGVKANEGLDILQGDCIMAKTDHHIYDAVESKADLDHVFSEIRKDVEGAKSRPALTELYKRAGYLITLTAAPSWKKKFGEKISSIREEARKDFVTTAHKINVKAKAIGTDADYDEHWGRN
jgi:2C-methyl-D-erythritol 2,4-cyclodiphosphate synthase